MKRIITAINAVVVAALIFVVGASSAKADDQKPLRIGIAPTSPPIQYWEHNEVAGLEVDFGKKLGEELGRKVEFVDMKFRDLIPSLLSKQIDIIMAGMSITTLRSYQVSFATPYLKIGQMPLARLEDRNKFVLPLDVIMTDKTVGVTENTTSEFLVVQGFPKAKKRMFSSQAAAANALKKGKIDLLILDSPYIYYLAAQNEGKLTPIPLLLTDENLAWALRKDDAPMLEQVNGILAKWEASGDLKKMIKNRIPGIE